MDESAVIAGLVSGLVEVLAAEFVGGFVGALFAGADAAGGVGAFGASCAIIKHK